MKGRVMAKTLVAHEQPIAKVFSDDYVFRIPAYQRPYAWTTEEARELFDDLLSFMHATGGPIEEMPPYFLGSIVLIKEETAPDADVVEFCASGGSNWGYGRNSMVAVVVGIVWSPSSESTAAIS